MIEKVTAFKASDGQIFNSIDLVQRHEIMGILSKSEANAPMKEAVAELLIANKAWVIDILTTGPRSKPKARAINGGRKNRAPKSTPQPATA